MNDPHKPKLIINLLCKSIFQTMQKVDIEIRKAPFNRRKKRDAFFLTICGPLGNKSLASLLALEKNINCNNCEWGKMRQK